MVVFTVENRNADLEREVTVQFATIEASATGRHTSAEKACLETIIVDASASKVESSENDHHF